MPSKHFTMPIRWVNSDFPSRLEEKKRANRVLPVPNVFLPLMVWGVSAVSLPQRDRLVWEDTATVRRNEGWVDLNFGVDNRG